MKKKKMSKLDADKVRITLRDSINLSRVIWHTIADCLRQVRDERLWELWGFSSMSSYYTTELDMTPAKYAGYIRLIDGFDRAGLTEADLPIVNTQIVSALSDFTPEESQVIITKIRDMGTLETRLNFVKAAASHKADNGTLDLSGETVSAIAAEVHCRFTFVNQEQSSYVKAVVERIKLEFGFTTDGSALHAMASAYEESVKYNKKRRAA